MNIQYNLPNRPLKMLIVNPISKTGELFCTKVMRGITFGLEQMVDLIFLVYSNEMERAEQLKYNLNQCGFPCSNSITITCDLPSFSDADIFVFFTDFPSLNSLDFDKIDDDVDIFDSLYLILKVASNLEYVPPPPEDDSMMSVKKRSKLLKPEPRKPLIIADGIVALDILSTYTKNLPKDIFFCPTPVTVVAKNILGDYLKVSIDDLNKVYVWGANEDTFHVEVKRPILLKEEGSTWRHCEWKGMSDIEKENLGFDANQFNPTWLKKEFIEKIRSMTSTHPHGPSYKALRVSNLLNSIWKTRRVINPKEQWNANCGIISDGSLHTIKGLPYVLPIVFQKEIHFVDHFKENDTHLKRELNLCNKAALEHHRKLIPYCNNFLERNVIKQMFLKKSSSLESSTTNFSIEGSFSGVVVDPSKINKLSQ